MPAAAERDAPRILLVDDDRDIGELVTAVLGDEGYEVTTLDQISDETVRAAIGSLEPDCILLDGVEAVAYAEAWATAANVRHRPRPIPTVMFTAHRFDAEEAVEGRSARSVDAGFTAVLRKPFHIDDLVTTVQRAIAAGVPFNHSERAEQSRTDELVARLTGAGARDVRPSARREWANFRNAAGEEMQLYWWQAAGAYLVARYSADGGRLQLVGHYYGLDAAIRAATVPFGAPSPWGSD
ncbi:MAG: response regulator [Chloroflexota bacterium]|nr:response regulator [Chloroflexota bacterium]